MNLISEAIEVAGGPVALAAALSDYLGGRPLSYQAIRKWERRGVLPRTEWTGETQYAQAIEHVTGGRITAAQLLEMRPAGSRPPGVALGAKPAPRKPPKPLHPMRRRTDRKRAAQAVK